MVNIRYFSITFILFLFFISYKTYAQDSFSIHTKVDMSNMLINDDHIIEIKVSPFFKYDKFFMALDFPVQINLDDANSLYNYYLYTSPSYYLQWIHTLSYGSAKDPFEYKIGSIHRLSLGEGSLMHEFYNDILLDDKGFFAKQDFVYTNIKAFTAHIANGSLGGVDLKLHPLDFMIASPYLTQVSFGATFIYDVDNHQIPYSDEVNLNLSQKNPDSERVLSYSTYIKLPIYHKDSFNLAFTYEYAGLIDQKQYSHYFKLSFDIPHYSLNLGVAYLQNGFYFNLFSTLYLNPQERQNRIHQFEGKDGVGYYLGNHLSFFDDLLSLQLDFFGQNQGSFSYYLAFNIKPPLLSTFVLSLLYVKENASSTFNAVDITNLDNSIIGLQMSYLFADNARMMVRYQKLFDYDYTNKKTVNDSKLSFTISLLF